MQNANVGLVGIVLAGLIGLASVNARGDMVQNLNLPTIDNHLMIETTFLTSVNYSTSGSVGNLTVSGVNANLNNNASSPIPTIHNVTGQFSLTATLDYSDPNQIKVTAGTLTITDGGSDFNASIAPFVNPMEGTGNFGFDFSNSGTELDFLFVQNNASVLPGIGTGTYLGEKLILGGYKPSGTPPTIFGTTTNFNLNSNALMSSKSDTFATAPLPSTAFGSMTLLGVCGFGLLARRRVAH